MSGARKQHGEKGVYYGGEWVDIEQCNDVFSIPHKPCHAKCADASTCPRSSSRHSACKADGSYDVVIIGAGCVGASIARELSRTTASVLLLEASDDVSQGATKGNSGIVHSGYDDKPGSVRAEHCWPGNQMFAQLDRELRFGYQKNGSMVLAFNDAEVQVLHELVERGHQNGVQGMQIISGEEVLRREPYANPDVQAALLSTEAGNLIPYEFAIALAENAVDNGVELRIRRTVVGIESRGDHFEVSADHWEPSEYLNAMKGAVGGKQQQSSPVRYAVALLPLLLALAGLLPIVYAAAGAIAAALAVFSLGGGKSAPAAGDSVGSGGSAVTVEQMFTGGSGSAAVNGGTVVQRETIKTRFLVNAAGGAADTIAAMVGDTSFVIKPRLGDYLLLHRREGKKAGATLFPTPHPELGKGVLCQTTLWGNLILGPTARDTYKPEMMNQSDQEIRDYILTRCKKLVPSFAAAEVFHGFAGARSKNSRGDWIIERSAANANMIHAAGIDSPGLAGSPSVALKVVQLLREAGLDAQQDPKFNPNRAPTIRPKQVWKGLKQGAFDDPEVNVICKCEKVTEEEVVTALRRSLPVDSTQAIRKRTRAGMGHCQGRKDNYDCECRVAQVIARELRVPVGAVGRRPWPATTTLPKRWLDKEEKVALTTTAT